MPERVPAPKPNRPRNPDAPPKPERPRDELGRPLPFGETSRLEMEDFDSFSSGAQPRAGHRALQRRAGSSRRTRHGRPRWKQAKGTPDAEFFKGLSQLGAGYVHLQRANAHGAFTLMRRAAGRIERYPSPHLGVDTEALAAAATPRRRRGRARGPGGPPDPRRDAAADLTAARDGQAPGSTTPKPLTASFRITCPGATRSATRAAHSASSSFSRRRVGVGPCAPRRARARARCATPSGGPP